MKKYYLDFKKSFPYYLDHIDWGNTLSKTLIDNVKFESGLFFTFLPEDADKSLIYNLSCGGILPSKGLQISNDGKGAWEGVDSTSDNLVEFVQSFLKESKEHYAIGEEVNYDINDKVMQKRNLHVLTKQNEVYYLLTGESSTDEVDDVVDFSNAIYHMILLLGVGNPNFPRQLKSEDFIRMANEAEYIIGSAYDRESYIIWKRKD